MPTYTGVLTELGGAEMSADGKHEKPRRVVVKADPSQTNGKTFRTWANSNVWDDLQPLLGQSVTVEFNEEQRQGPKGPYTQNSLVSVTTNGSSATPEGGDGGWGPPSSTDESRVWGSSPGASAAETSQPSSAPSPMSRDDYWEQKAVLDEERSRHMATAWSISQAIALLSVGATASPPAEKVHEVAHQLLILKERIVSETGDAP